MTWTVLKIYFKPLMCSRTESVKQTEVRTHLLFGCSANPAGHLATQSESRQDFLKVLYLIEWLHVGSL